MSDVQPSKDLKRAAPNNVTPASSSKADDFSLCGDGIVIKPVPNELSSGEVVEKPVVEKPVKPVVEKPVVETPVKPVVEKPKPVEKPAPLPAPKKQTEKPAPKPSPAKEKVLKKQEVPVESPIIDESDDEEPTPEKPKADSVKSSKSGTSKKVNTAPVDEVVKKELKDSKTVIDNKKQEKKIETIQKELKKNVPVEKVVKTTKLLGSMKKVSFGDSTFCLGFAEKKGDPNFYAKCELEDGKCPTEFNPLTCTLAPIHLSDVLHKAVLTKL